jgi:mannosyl-oligosaccharide alpha-1,2-mannosidase
MVMKYTSRYDSLSSDEAKRLKVIGMMRHAWDGYEKYAFGADHLEPISKGRNEWMGLGISILDSLDTSYIMGEMDIYHKCREWIKKNFTIDPVKYRISLFETNIRVVGGFLSTYALTNDQLFLEKAIQVIF